MPAAYGGAKLPTIFDLITTNETYFFREPRQLKAFQDEIIPEILERKKDSRTLRIWSAGCSSGEEPYTLAILCKQIPELHDWNIDIYASDISQKVIQTARRGIFPVSSFRNTEESIRHIFFESIAEKKYRIKDEIKQ